MANVIRGRHYATGDLCEWHVADGVIRDVRVLESSVQGDIPWIAPAFFDIQINGGLGISFNAPTLTHEQIRQVTQLCRSHGIAEYFPTLITASHDDLAHGFRTLSHALEQDRDLADAIPGFHLEGPFISPEDGARGAHPKVHVRQPTWDEFARLQDAAGGRIRLLTLAPEHEGAIPFIEKATAAGIVIAIGHTAATPDIICRAVDAGAKMSTHLGNGSHAMLPRHENYLLAQLAEDRLIASCISDGHHLPDALLRILMRVKGPERLVLTCDASSLAGLPPGRHQIWGAEFDILPTGKITVPGTTFLAGSGVYTDRCVEKMLSLNEWPLKDVLDMAGNRLRELMGLARRELKVGEPAEMVRVAGHGKWQVTPIGDTGKG